MHDHESSQLSTTSTAEHPLVPEILQALRRVDDPEIRRPITDLGMVDEIDVDAEGRARVRVLLTVSGCPLRDTLHRDVTAAVGAVAGVTAVDVELGLVQPPGKRPMAAGDWARGARLEPDERLG